MQASSESRRALLLVAALGLVPRLALILAYPGVYGDDATARLAHSNLWLLAYQLPLPQLVVGVTRALDPDPLWTRLAFAAIGSLVPVALTAALRPDTGRFGARLAGALAALHPLLLYYSLVPYQESLMLLLLLLAGCALRRGSDVRAGAWLGLACLCRYEAWIAAALACFARRARPLRSALLFGWAPLGWLVLWRGLSPAGTYVLDLDAGGRWSRAVFLWDKLREYSGFPLVGLAAVGVLWAARGGRRPGFAWGGAWLAAVLLAVVVAGHESPPGSGRVSERLAQVPALALCALAGPLLAAAVRAAPTRARTALALVLGGLLTTQAVAWLRFSRDLVRQAQSDPSLELAVDVARLAARELAPGERLSVRAPRVDPAAVAEYVRKVERAGGDAQRAREIARSFTEGSPDADRIAANLARAPGTVVGPDAAAALIARYDDAPAVAPQRPGILCARFSAGPRAVSVYRSSTR